VLELLAQFGREGGTVLLVTYHESASKCTGHTIRLSAKQYVTCGRLQAYLRMWRTPQLVASARRPTGLDELK
jgi:hypothetical protein